MSRKKLYSLLSVLLIAGYAWIFFHYNGGREPNKLPVCLFKGVSGIPCPSCGTTHSVESLLEGNVMQALYWNPLGIPVALLLLILPLLLLYDIFTRKSTLYHFYRQSEVKLRKPLTAIIMISLVSMNWIWNIYKGL